MVGVAIIVALVAIANPLRGQERAAFEVASIKPHPNPERKDLRFPQFLPSGRFQATIGLFQIVQMAYDLPFNLNDRVSVSPGAMRELKQVYDIDAVGAFPQGLDGRALADRRRLMLRALLADRFKLSTHYETREMPVYALRVDKRGPKLQRADIAEKDCPASLVAQPADSSSDCHVISGGQGRGLHARAASIADVVHYVENWTVRPLIDQTGIKGLYKFDTSGWTPLQVGPPPPEGTKAEDGRDFADVPTLFQVFQGLGLKMEASKAHVEVLVIDHAEEPTQN